MIKDNVRIIRDYYSGERAKNIISGVINFNRVQASTGYREAARYCEKILKDSGIDASVLSFPANDNTKCFTVSMFKEWDCKGAYLDLISPERIRLADYDVNAMSLLQRSWGADYRDEDLEVVYLNRGKEKEKYDDIDLKGKLIFVTGEYWEYAKWAVGERGAVGVIIDNMPDLDGVKQRSRLYDATNVTSISGRRLTEDMRMFGFILTPRLGDRLRRICENMEREHAKDGALPRYPKVRAYVDARSYDGHLEDVMAIIPGETDEEIIISAHLCHVKACANDNSSGVAASMEAVKTISDLIKSGRLKKPKRSIRLLLVPELSGTYAYLCGKDKAEISKIKAGVNLDMVGAPQINGSGTVMVGDVPNSAPSFVIDAAELILSEIKKEVDFFDNGEYLSTFNSEMKDYMVGSDHYVFSDPTIGVPSIAISQWPDGVYHTSADTIENIDAAILERTGSLCAAYVYTMASLSADDVQEILVRMRAGFIKRLCDVTKEHGCQHDDSCLNTIYEEIMHYKNVYIGRVEDMGRFFTGSDADAVGLLVDEQKKFLNDAAEEYFQQYLTLAGATGFKYEPDAWGDEYLVVPERTFTAPLAEGKEYDGELGKRQKALNERYPDYFFISDYINNWIDGKRTIADIAAGVAIEGKLRDKEFVRDYIMLLCDANYAVIRDRRQS